MTNDDRAPDERGLCAVCRHAKVIVSDKEHEYIRCGLSDSDRTFARYPRLPVADCRGFESKSPRVP